MRRIFAGLLAALTISIPSFAYAQSGFVSGQTGAGTVTSIATACGASGGTITSTGTISSSLGQNASSIATTLATTTDALCGQQLNLTYATGAKTVNMSAAATNGAGWYTTICNNAANTATLTPASGTIGGAATYVLADGSASAPSCVQIAADVANTDYKLSFVPSTGGAWTNPYTAPAASAMSASSQISFFSGTYPTAGNFSTYVSTYYGTNCSGTTPSLGTLGQAIICGGSTDGITLQGLGNGHTGVITSFRRGDTGAEVAYIDYFGTLNMTGNVNSSSVTYGPHIQFGTDIQTNASDTIVSKTLPTISSGFNTSGGSVTAKSTLAFKVTVGTGTATSTGVLSMPTATTAWNCHVTNMTNPTTRTTVMTAHASNSVTVTNYDHSATTWVATNFGNGDDLEFVCGAY